MTAKTKLPEMMDGRPLNEWLASVADKLSYEEIGRRLGCSAKCVKRRLTSLRFVRYRRPVQEAGFIAPPPKYDENPPQETPGDVKALLATCPRCHWQTTVGFIRWGRTERWQPEPDQKLRIMPNGGIVHRECGTNMELWR